jgi:hypothetical protein
MNPDSAPRLNKWIFIGIDGLLLVIAFAIVYLADNPYAPLPFVSAIILVALAAIIGIVPFLTDFAAESADYVRAERARVAEQAQRLQSAADSLTRAAAQIKAVEEAVHKSAREAETLPYRMQEKLAEFNEALAARESDDREALETELEELRGANSERLKAIAEKIHATTSELTALEAAARKQLGAAQDALARLQGGIAEGGKSFDEKAQAAIARFETRSAALLDEMTKALAALQSAATSVQPRSTAPAIAAQPTPAPEPAPTPAQPVDDAREAATAHPIPAPAIVTEIMMTETTPSTDTAPPFGSSEPPKPKKPRAPRRPKPDDILAEMSESAPVAVAESAPPPTSAAGESDPGPGVNGSEAVVASAEASASSDGATRLLATAYIGIGNKLFLRGDGPGLSWDSGVPMQFVSIGKWGWSTQESVNPIHCKLYKNDDIASLTGEIVLEPGRHTEVTALF